jgi:PIN domain nuclease of toxin-antitoxin system
MESKTDAIVLDTHVLLWWQAESTLLSNKARNLIERAEVRLISPISFWELSMLIKKGRVALDRPTSIWVNDLLSNERVEVAEFAPTTAVSAGELPDFHGDPADRIIVASAVSAGVPLLTKDQKIRDWASQTKLVKAVW